MCQTSGTLLPRTPLPACNIFHNMLRTDAVFQDMVDLLVVRDFYGHGSGCLPVPESEAIHVMREPHPHHQHVLAPLNHVVDVVVVMGQPGAWAVSVAESLRKNIHPGDNNMRWHVARWVERRWVDFRGIDFFLGINFFLGIDLFLERRVDSTIFSLSVCVCMHCIYH